MRVLVATSGSRGDTAPSIAVAEKLKALGHEVTVAASAPYEADVTGRGLAFKSVGLDMQEMYKEIQKHISKKSWLPTEGPSRWIMELTRRDLKSQLDGLPEAARGMDLMVGCGLLMGGRTAAEYVGVPYKYLAHAPWIYRTSHHPPHLVPHVNFPRPLNVALWRMFMGFTHWMLGETLNTWRTEHGMPRVRNAFQHGFYDVKDVVLIAESELSPVPPDLSWMPPHVGYPMLSSDEQLPADVERFLAAGPPPVHIGFGSQALADPDAVTRMVVTAIQKSGCRALVSQGWGGMNADVNDDQVMFHQDGLPFITLFPRLAGVIHSGGSGTAATAARSGIPQMVIPHANDHFYWAKHLPSLSLGPAGIPIKKVTVENLAAAIRDLATNDRYKTAARELRQRAEARSPDPATGAARALVA